MALPLYRSILASKDQNQREVNFLIENIRWKMEILKDFDTITLNRFLAIVYNRGIMRDCIHGDNFTLCFCPGVAYDKDFYYNMIVAFKMVISSKDIDSDWLCPCYSNCDGAGCWPAIVRNNGIRIAIDDSDEDTSIKDLFLRQNRVVKSARSS